MYRPQAGPYRAQIFAQIRMPMYGRVYCVELVALWRRFLVAPCRNSARKASTYSQYIAAAREQRRIS